MFLRTLPLVACLGLVLAACGKDDRTLKVTGLDPVKGDVEGGTYVRIMGNRFMKDGPRAAKVYFGNRQGTVVRFQSDSELIVQAPGGKHDESVDVLVIFDPGGQLKIEKAFKFIDKQDESLNINDFKTDDKNKKK